MIYLFNESKTLFSIVSREELLSFLYEREVNALYQASVEMPVQSTDKNGLTRNLYNEMQNATYFGHYDLNDKFQLHKIVSIDVTGDSFITTAVHLFFDEAKALAVTEERRFIDRPIEDSVIYAFGLIGWTLVEFDVSDAKTVSFFNDTVLDAQAKIIKTFGFKFDYWLDFDGQKITSKKVKVKEELGTQTHQRYVYGHNTLGIKMETDFSEIYTAVLGRGHGERIENLDDEGNETGDTFGRRIEFDEVEWSISSGDPLDKDLGERILVDPDSTQIFGYVREDDTVAPRVKVVEFSDIEDKEELIQASYEWLMENNSPKAVYSVEVLETEELDLGDEVYVVYRDIDFVKSARVSRVVDDLLTERRAVEFGDSDYFRRNSETSRLQRELQDTKNDSADYIQDLKRQANARIDAEMQQARDDFEQAWIEVHAEIDAIDERMATEIANEIASFETEFNAEVQAAKDLAAQQIADETERIENIFRGITDDHDVLIQQNRDNIADVNDFIGSRDKTLQIILDEQRAELEQKIEVYSRSYPNLQVGTTFENIQGWRAWQGKHGELELRTNESLNFVRVHPNGSNTPSMESLEAITLESDKHYVVAVDFRSDDVQDLDNSYFLSSNGNIIIPSVQTRGLTADGEWHRYYFNHDMTGRASGNYKLMLGTHFVYGDSTVGTFDLRQIHVYEGTEHRIPWSPSPLDNSQIVSQILYEIRELEDGMSSLATKTEFDILTGNVTQLTNEFTSTSALVSSKLQSFDDLLGDNGSHFTQVADQVQSKVWLSDIHNPNMLSHNDVSVRENQLKWDRSLSQVTGVSYGEWFQVTHGTSPRTYLAVYSPTFEVVAGESYTVTFESWENGNDSSNTSGIMDYVFLTGSDINNISIWSSNKRKSIGSINGATIYKNEMKFTATQSTKNARLLIGTRVNNTGQRSTFRFRHPKIELGNRATPYYTAFSGLTQRVDEISLLVQDIDGSGLVRQSDITVSPSSVRIGSTEILGDSVLSSILNVSPSAIDMITQKMRLSGDLYVDGDITALAVTAIEGNFARLFASAISTVDLNADNITTGTLSSTRLQVNNALINRLISNSILTSEMRAQSLTAVRGDIADLRTRILTSDVITSNHLKVENALINKLFATSALISRLTSKSAFISQVQTIDLAADQVRVGFNGISNNVTINSSGITIDRGALTVNRTDGGAPTIIDGVNPSGIALFPATPHRRDSEFTIQGQYAVRDSGSNFMIYDFYMFEWFYSDLMFDFAIYNFENHDIRVRIEITGTDGSTFSKAVDYTVPHTPTRVRFPRMILNLGVPDGSLQRFFIRVRNVGTSSQHGKFGVHTYMVKHLDNGHGYPRLEI